MKFDASRLIVPVIALLLLGVVLQQSSSALRTTGMWRRQATAATQRANDPYLRLEALMRPDTLDRVTRDPFAYGAATSPRPSTRPITGRPAVTDTTRREPPRPRLTSIVFDADPRATLHWNGREYTVREGALFDEYQVVRITAADVTLTRGGVPFTLTLPRQGD